MDESEWKLFERMADTLDRIESLLSNAKPDEFQRIIEREAAIVEAIQPKALCKKPCRCNTECTLHCGHNMNHEGACGDWKA